jgi:hypothetical protein
MTILLGYHRMEYGKDKQTLKTTKNQAKVEEFHKT